MATYNRQETLQLVLSVLSRDRGRWAGAVEIALELGWPWRIVARTMVRLTQQGLVDQKIIEYMGTRFRVRTQRLYRAKVVSDYPCWLMPRAAARPPSRIIKF